MTREKAMEKFLEEHRIEKEKIREEVMTEILANISKIMELILELFSEVGKQIKEQEKKNNVYFQFSLQRCDLLENKVVIRLDVMDSLWYMDEDIVTAEMDLTFLFHTYFTWKKQLLLDMRSYMGKVNRYDVENLVQDEIVDRNQVIAQLLRFALRNIEEQEWFRYIDKMPFWIIQWGEYKAGGQILIRVNRKERGKEEWLEKLEEYSSNKQSLFFEHWYQLELEKGNCRKKKMHFICFEDCVLSHIDFCKSDLLGARFIRCQLNHCKFIHANLQQVDFEDCQFKDNVFKDANMVQSTFSKWSFPWQDFDEKQLDELLIVDKEVQGGDEKEW